MIIVLALITMPIDSQTTESTHKFVGSWEVDNFSGNIKITKGITELQIDYIRDCFVVTLKEIDDSQMSLEVCDAYLKNGILKIIRKFKTNGRLYIEDIYFDEFGNIITSGQGFKRKP